MTVYTVPAGPLRANSYLITQDGENAVLIDCGGKEPLLFAKEKGLSVRYVLLTHGHFDHIGGVAALQAAGATAGCSQAEEALALGKDNMAAQFGAYVPAFRVDFTFRGGETLELCGMRLLVIATPGHTAGSVCFLADGKLFTGDTLFAGSVGRTDLPTGSGARLTASVKALYALEGDFPVYPGHGEDTTLGYERRNNGWIRC